MNANSEKRSAPTPARTYVNVGCGTSFHPDWINFDLVSTSPYVREYDLRKGIPLADESADACYSSHVLEHLIADEAFAHVSECFRVLKRGGIIRIVVPDLEGIVLAYLAALEHARREPIKAQADYDWMVLEMYDQTVRTVSGGEMTAFLKNPALSSRAFVVSRAGQHAIDVVQATQHGKVESDARPSARHSFTQVVNRARLKLASISVRVLGGKDMQRSLHEGVFRNAGEIHRHMYDSFSLARLLTEAGFSTPIVCCADESSIPDFSHYGLDMFDGQPRKPDSLYMEAVKP